MHTRFMSYHSVGYLNCSHHSVTFNNLLEEATSKKTEGGIYPSETAMNSKRGTLCPGSKVHSLELPCSFWWQYFTHFLSFLFLTLWTYVGKLFTWMSLTTWRRHIVHGIGYGCLTEVPSLWLRPSVTHVAQYGHHPLHNTAWQACVVSPGLQ